MSEITLNRRVRRNRRDAKSRLNRVFASAFKKAAAPAEHVYKVDGKGRTVLVSATSTTEDLLDLLTNTRMVEESDGLRVLGDYIHYMVKKGYLRRSERVPSQLLITKKAAVHYKLIGRSWLNGRRLDLSNYF